MASPGIGVQIDSSRVQRLMTIAPQRVKAAKKEILDRGGIMTQAEMRINAPIHDGELRQSIRPKMISQDTVIVFSDKKYAIPVEFGRRPNGKLPPWREGTPLHKWVKDKMGTDVSPYLVARSIAKKGTKGTKFARKTYVTMKPQVQAMSNQVIAKTIRGLNR
jgi:hypothetical protein